MEDKPQKPKTQNLKPQTKCINLPMVEWTNVDSSDQFTMMENTDE